MKEMRGRESHYATVKELPTFPFIGFYSWAYLNSLEHNFSQPKDNRGSTLKRWLTFDSWILGGAHFLVSLVATGIIFGEDSKG